MTLLIASFIAGILTILAPCILPVIPILIGATTDDKRSKLRPILTVTALLTSILLFTLLLKASTVLLGVPSHVWQYVSAVILAVVGLSFIVPTFWDTLSDRTGFAVFAQQRLASANTSGTFIRPVALGVALGPVFSSCSPTYLFIVAAILPVSVLEGLVYLTSYLFGLGIILLSIIFAGRSLTSRLRWSLNPHGWFRRSVGWLLVATAVVIALGLDKSLQTAILDSGLYDPIVELETSILPPTN